MARRRVADLMKGGLRKFPSVMPQDKDGLGRFREEGSIPPAGPATVPAEASASTECATGCSKRDGVGQETPAGVARLAPDDPMNWVNPSFADKQFFEEYVAILKEIRDSELVTGDEAG